MRLFSRAGQKRISIRTSTVPAKNALENPQALRQCTSTLSETASETWRKGAVWGVSTHAVVVQGLGLRVEVVARVVAETIAIHTARVVAEAIAIQATRIVVAKAIAPVAIIIHEILLRAIEVVEIVAIHATREVVEAIVAIHATREVVEVTATHAVIIHGTWLEVEAVHATRIVAVAISKVGARGIVSRS